MTGRLLPYNILSIDSMGNFMEIQNVYQMEMAFKNNAHTVTSCIFMRSVYVHVIVFAMAFVHRIRIEWHSHTLTLY